MVMEHDYDAGLHLLMAMADADVRAYGVTYGRPLPAGYVRDVMSGRHVRQWRPRASPNRATPATLTLLRGGAG